MPPRSRRSSKRAEASKTRASKRRRTCVSVSSRQANKTPSTPRTSSSSSLQSTSTSTPSSSRGKRTPSTPRKRFSAAVQSLYSTPSSSSISSRPRRTCSTRRENTSSAESRLYSTPSTSRDTPTINPNIPAEWDTPLGDFEIYPPSDVPSPYAPFSTPSFIKKEVYAPKSLYAGDPDSENEEVKSKLKPRPHLGFAFMNLLHYRQLGLGSTSFPEIAFEMKAADFQKIKSERFSSNERVSYTTYFVKGGKSSLVCSWYVQIGHTFMTAIGHLPYDLSNLTSLNVGYIVSSNTIVDACEIKADTTAFAYTTVRPHGGELLIAICNSYQEPVQYNTLSFYHPFSQQFWCCNSNFFIERIALGCDGEVCLYSIDGLDEIRTVEDSVCSLAFNERGSVLHIGTVTGDLTKYDMRTSLTVSRVKIDPQMVDDVLVLSDENYSIVSGVSSVLSKVDHRMNKVVVEYPKHDRRSKRIPVSVNEKLDLLCCTGADDITRLWCLSTGRYVKRIQAPSTYPARGVLVPESISDQMYLVQDNFIHVYSMLR